MPGTFVGADTLLLSASEAELMFEAYKKGAAVVV